MPSRGIALGALKATCGSRRWAWSDTNLYRRAQAGGAWARWPQDPQVAEQSSRSTACPCPAPPCSETRASEAQILPSLAAGGRPEGPSSRPGKDSLGFWFRFWRAGRSCDYPLSWTSNPPPAP